MRRQGPPGNPPLKGGHRVLVAQHGSERRHLRRGPARAHADEHGALIRRARINQHTLALRNTRHLPRGAVTAELCGDGVAIDKQVAELQRRTDHEPLAEEVGISRPPGSRPHGTGAPDPIFTLKALQDLAGRMQRADCLEALVDSTSRGSRRASASEYSMILVPSEEPGTLVTIATHG